MQFVDEEGVTGFFMIGGDVNGSWKPASAQLFSRKCLDAISPDMFRHVSADSKR